MEIVPLLHIASALFINIYGFIIEKNSLDYYYVLYIYIVALSWTLFNGDCLITYYYNKQTNPSYQPGDFRESSDLHVIFGKKYAPFIKRHHVELISIFLFITVLSMYRVFIRQHFSVLSTLSLLSVYIIYYVSIMSGMNLHALFFVLLLYCLLYIVTSWK